MAANPYSTPQSRVTVTDNDLDYGEIRLLSFRGRLGRVRFLVFYSLLGLATVLLIMALSMVLFGVLSSGGYDASTGQLLSTGYMVLVVIVSLLGIPLGVMLSMQRLHDFNASGWWSLLALVPVVQLALLAALLFVPGTLGANRYGRQPPPHTARINALGAFVVGLLVLVIAASAMLGLSGSFTGYLF